MVVSAFASQVDQRGRWLVYLALSVCANIFLVSLVHLNTQQELVFEVPVLQVNLMTLARPAPSPPPERQIVKSTPPISMPARIRSFVATPFSAEKVAEVPEIPQPKIEPAADKLVKATPLPRIRPIKLATKPLEIKPREVKPAPKLAEKKLAQIFDVPKERLVESPAKLIQASATPASNHDAGQDEATVIHEARYRHQVPPSYPRRALDMGQQGIVLLHAKVLPSGTPRDLKIVHSSGYRLLDMAAVAAVKKWRFEPTSVNGNAVVSWVRVPVNFVIQ
ncbi:MAG: hypothetical protein COB93_11280 [Sneathiella sp.]|nr:MAG: hypothetical protein COB93_11280 [Sneathiella sp.]